MIKLLDSEGLKTKVERGNRVFPITDNAQSVIDALESKLKKLKVKVITNAHVTDILEEDRKVIGVEYIHENKKQIMKADKVIIATRRLKLFKYGFKSEKDIRLLKSMDIL